MCTEINFSDASVALHIHTLLKKRKKLKQTNKCTKYNINCRFLNLIAQIGAKGIDKNKIWK